jgi:NodT family efflux transporter outer membrane factor (OMF) lipoprotein
VGTLRATAAIALCGAVALSGCSMIPAYTRPTAAVPAHYAQASPAPGMQGAGATSGWSPAAPSDAVPRGNWWTVFGDAQLNGLEARVDVSNQTVKKAIAQLNAARAMIDYQRAGFFPTITAGVAQNRARTSANVKFKALAGKTVPDYSAGLAASWEPDLFGKISSSVAAANADAQASAADLEAVRLAVSAELATDYFDLRATDTQKKLVDDAVVAYARALEMVQQRYRIGASDPSVVAQAQTQLETTQAQDTDLGVQRAQLEHAIATLVGEPASTFSIAPELAPPSIPSIPAGLPSQLLERRPDIAATERRVAAGNARIGEAHAAFFPSLVLSAAGGLESTFFAPWLTAPSLFWSLGPQLVGTLFDGGRRSATLHGADAQYDSAVADYRQTVLSAFQQVEDNLSALNVLSTEAVQQQRAVDAASLSLRLSLDRYRAGAVDYLTVVTAQTALLTNQRTAADIARRREDASVALIKALGGGADKPDGGTEKLGGGAEKPSGGTQKPDGGTANDAGG